jgi:protein ImuB
MWPSSASPIRSASNATCSPPSPGSPGGSAPPWSGRQDGARLLQVALFRTDNKVYRIEVGTGAPLREAGFGYDMVRLAALVTERSEPVQAALVHTGHTAPDGDVELWHLIDRLGARFGPRRVTRLVPQDTHIPEFAVAAVPAARRTDGYGTAPLLPLPACGERVGVRGPRKSAPTSPRVRGEVFAAGAAMCDSEGVQDRTQDSIGPTRPIRLFARPEPVEAIAEVPDGPPARFRWRRVLHEVAIAEGPERIAMEWWRDETGQALTRDYFRLECRDGLRAWLYREGLFGRETAQPRWFLHGVFA